RTAPSDNCKISSGGSASSNDANHISGPSRTGQELSHAINVSLEEAGMKPGDISYISAHGTATPFNDEMESKAVSLSGLSDVPLNSFKGYWGHTLGAAGIIESAAAIHSLKKNMLFRSAGFDSPGVSEKITVIEQHARAVLRSCLKTASGFGGCNASIIFEKI
ncbi:MAG: beta-ketoacyl synthase, partial [bacterium]